MLINIDHSKQPQTLEDSNIHLESDINVIINRLKLQSLRQHSQKGQELQEKILRK
jgi:hypothetical protein